MTSPLPPTSTTAPYATSPLTMTLTTHVPEAMKQLFNEN